MAFGPGEYNAETTALRKQLGAAGIILIVIDGDRGNGVSIQTIDPGLHLQLPTILRTLANNIETVEGN